MSGYIIAGRAVLDNGDAATRVLVRRLLDAVNVADLTPDADGNFSVAVDAGDYDVCIFGPDTYAPVIFAPVAAQPADA